MARVRTKGLRRRFHRALQTVLHESGRRTALGKRLSGGARGRKMKKREEEEGEEEEEEEEKEKEKEK